jgi:hypothetical protein
MTIEEVKHPDLQKAVKDIATVLDIKQNHVAGRQVLIDFVVNTIGGCIGPNPENPEEQIWVDERAGDLKPETLATYEALATPAAEPDPSAVEQQSPEVAAAEATGQPDPKEAVVVQDGAEADPAEKTEAEVVGEEAGTAQPKECPEFGKGYDATDPACAKPCKRAEECQDMMAEAKAAKKKTTTSAPKEPKEPKAPSARQVMLDLLCGDPTMTKETLTAKVAAAGFTVTPVSLSTVFSDCQSVFKRLREAGHLAA